MDPMDWDDYEGGGGTTSPSADGGSIFDGVSGFFDGAWDAVGGALGTYMDFENWKFDRKMTASQQQAQLARANAETARMVNPGLGGMSSQTLITFAVLGIAGLLVFKLVK